MELTSKDIIKLADMMAHIKQAQSPNSHNGINHFMYYFPADKKYTDKALAIFKKYNLPAEQHMSSLNNRAFPIIRFPLTKQNIKQMHKMALQLQTVQEARKHPHKKESFIMGQMKLMKDSLNTAWHNLQDLFGHDK